MTALTTRHFLTYRGVRLPLQLSEALQPEELRNRNTWFEARYDSAADDEPRGMDLSAAGGDDSA